MTFKLHNKVRFCYSNHSKELGSCFLGAFCGHFGLLISMLKIVAATATLFFMGLGFDVQQLHVGPTCHMCTAGSFILFKVQQEQDTWFLHLFIWLCPFDLQVQQRGFVHVLPIL